MKLAIIRERIMLLQRVDVSGPNYSRLLGFLQFRKHRVLLEVLSQANLHKHDKDTNDNNQYIASLGKEVSESLHEAWMILKHDGSCPAQLKDAAQIFSLK